MLVYPAIDLSSQGNRKQPWDKTITHQYRQGKYYDFRKHPELIETSLEDFVDYSDNQAIQTFYSILKWINSDTSALESTDCLFSGTPATNGFAVIYHSTHSSNCRLEFFIREIEHNNNEHAIGWILNKLSIFLQVENPDFRKGTFGIVPLVTEYLTAGGIYLHGYRICIYIDAYGNGIIDTWNSLDVLFNGLMKSLKRMSNEMISGGLKPL
ncbi:hypothetical protein AAAM04_001465 [Salmonella enterica]